MYIKCKKHLPYKPYREILDMFDIDFPLTQMTQLTVLSSRRHRKYRAKYEHTQIKPAREVRGRIHTEILGSKVISAIQTLHCLHATALFVPNMNTLYP